MRIGCTLLNVLLRLHLSCVFATLLACSSSTSNDNDAGGDGSTGVDGAMTNDQSSPPPSDGSFDGPIPPPATTGITITVEPDGSGDAAAVLNAISSAQTAVHVEMYLLTNSKYIDALIALAKAGKDVKVLLNQTFPTGTSASDTNAATYTQLQGGGVNVKWAPTNTGFSSYTHEKAVIIDPAGGSDSQVWIMTMNLDTDAPKYNREFLAQDVNAPDITEAEAIFEADYGDTDVTPSGNLIVAPSPQNNAVSALVALINSATTSIDLESEELDDSGSNTEELVFNALVAKAKAGVTVHVVLEDSSNTSQSSAVTSLQAAGAKVVGYSCSGNLDIHAKALVADGARAYVGSENFSGGSLGYNRELGVIFNEASEVTKVDSTITSDFAAGATYSTTCTE
jgi:phosphatidylserine/phosphatidylglycerophosphate/cardiolipin synthase-like enzyme